MQTLYRNKLDEELAQEIELGQFNGKIKSHCAWCNAKIPKSISRYIEYGNACLVCNSRFTRALEGVRSKSRARNKKGQMYTKSTKIRDFTEEEVIQMLADRISEVKYLKL